MDKKLTLFILFGNIFLFVLGNYALTYSHEQEHKQINSNFGCDSIVKVGLFSGSVKAIQCDLSLEDQKELRNLQSIVETDYSTIAFQRFGLIYFMLIVGVLVVR